MTSAAVVARVTSAASGRRVVGMPSDGEATVCATRGSDLSGGLVLSFNVCCKVEGCRKESRKGAGRDSP